DHGVDLYKIMDVAEDLIVPMMDQPQRIDRDALILGYAGVYSSFLLFAQRAGERYGVSSRDILVEMGRRKTVGGQEDMVEDVALALAKAAKKSAPTCDTIAPGERASARPRACPAPVPRRRLRGRAQRGRGRRELHPLPRAALRRRPAGLR